MSDSQLAAITVPAGTLPDTESAAGNNGLLGAHRGKALATGHSQRPATESRFSS